MIEIDRLIDKIILVGLTYINENDEIVEKKSFCGKIISITENSIDVLIKDTKKVFSLPPDITSIEEAKKGKYYIYSTKEVIKNPDYISTWTIRCQTDSLRLN